MVIKNFFLILWPRWVAYGIVVPWSGIDLVPTSLEGGALTTGLPEKSPSSHFWRINTVLETRALLIGLFIRKSEETVFCCPGVVTSVFDHWFKDVSEGRCAAWVFDRVTSQVVPSGGVTRKALSEHLRGAECSLGPRPCAVSARSRLRSLLLLSLFAFLRSSGFSGVCMQWTHFPKPVLSHFSHVWLFATPWTIAH